MGTVFSPSNGKNVLSVGAVYNSPYYSDIRATFSCQGPTSDKRIKPDIMAPGVSIDSAASSGSDKSSCRIVSKTGTSMSTPIVAATALLISEYFKKGFYPSGEENAADSFSPTAATMKAMIIHSGQSLRGEGNPLFPTTYTGSAPDNKQGFGRMDINKVLYWRNESAFNLLVREGEVNRTSMHLRFWMLVDISLKGLFSCVPLSSLLCT